MAQYFIDLRDACGMIRDEEGAEFTSLEEALTEAKDSARDLVKQFMDTEEPTMPYSLEDLKRKLADDGWRTNVGSSAFPVQGTLGEMVEGAHGRRKSGQAVGVVEEIETEIKIDMIQLEELWWHMGLPTI